MRTRIGGSRWLAFLAAGAAACAGSQLGASDADLELAKSQASQGADVYASSCAQCHGERGEGRGNWPKVIGPGALRVFPRDQANTQFVDPALLQQQSRNQVPGKASRPPFRTAKDVFDYISTRMPQPPNRAGSLRQEQYWAVLNFMLLAHGLKLPPGGINQGNAASVQLQSQ